MTASAPAADWRLFLGLWPTDAQRAQLQALSDGWDWPASARRTPPERLHVTLHFLGNVPVAQVPALKEVLAVPWEGCTLQLDAAQVWPGGIAVLEATRVAPELARLHAMLGEALVRSGVAVEARRYRPHVTFARKAQGAKPPPCASFEWTVTPHFALLRSLPGGRGYEGLALFGA
jgi:2'-5' RNA ligase